MENLKVFLKSWNRDIFRDVNKKINSLELHLDKLEKMANHRDLTEVELVDKKSKTHELWMALRSKESIWKKKSGVAWLKEGDKNTKFFHCSAKIRARMNVISGFFSYGVWIADPKKVKALVFDHFCSFFCEVNPHWNIVYDLPFQSSCPWKLLSLRNLSLSQKSRKPCGVTKGPKH
ncbi:hypothetical protein REPUB_Repub09cG0003600 [Reevesia pubescens]